MDENMKYRIKNQKLAELVYSVFDKEDVQRQIEYQINGPYDEFIFTSDKEANIVIKLRTEYDDLENAKVNVQINIDKDEIEKIREYDPKGWNPFPQVEPPKNGEYLVQRTKENGEFDFWIFTWDKGNPWKGEYVFRELPEPYKPEVQE